LELRLGLDAFGAAEVGAAGFVFVVEAGTPLVFAVVGADAHVCYLLFLLLLHAIVPGLVTAHSLSDEVIQLRIYVR